MKLGTANSSRFSPLNVAPLPLPRPPALGSADPPLLHHLFKFLPLAAPPGPRPGANNQQTNFSTVESRGPRGRGGRGKRGVSGGGAPSTPEVAPPLRLLGQESEERVRAYFRPGGALPYS